MREKGASVKRERIPRDAKWGTLIPLLITSPLFAGLLGSVLTLIAIAASALFAYLIPLPEGLSFEESEALLFVAHLAFLFAIPVTVTFGTPLILLSWAISQILGWREPKPMARAVAVGGTAFGLLVALSFYQEALENLILFPFIGLAGGLTGYALGHLIADNGYTSPSHVNSASSIAR